MKFNQYTWSLYKQSDNGKKAISEFEDASEKEFDLIRKYNPTDAKSLEEDSFYSVCADLWDYSVSTNKEVASLQEAKEAYESCISLGLIIDGEVYVKPDDYEFMLGGNLILSFLFYEFAPDYFIPNLFKFRFFDLNKIADLFEIDIPPIPKKSDYKARCMYYWELCEVFYKFRVENNLSPSELCAFLYDYSPNLIENKNAEMPEPAQAWFIGGLIRGYGEQWTIGFWQTNPETKKGDILIHYETSPVSAITCLWIAQTDGVIDPFFHYYSNTYISDRVEIPHITLKELREDEYFSKHPLIRKNFQGVNGWTASSEDYSQLLRIIKSKGYDISSLPQLYAPSVIENASIKDERGVEVHLLEYYLNNMGLHENIDYIRQIPIKAGRGNRIYPDYAVHYNNSSGYESAKILIEAKFHMKNNRDIEEAFKQARSYANLLESSTIILCDKNLIIIYEKKNGFDRDRYKKIYWSELENPDKYNELVKVLINYKT